MQVMCYCNISYFGTFVNLMLYSLCIVHYFFDYYGVLLCISKVGCNYLFYKISKLFVVLGALRCVIGFMNLFSRISLWAAYVHNFCG